MCEDNATQCAVWAMAGECQRSADFVLPLCPSTCHACGPDPREEACLWDTHDDTLGVPPMAVRSMIDRAFSAELRDTLRPELLSEDPPILLLDSFLSADDAENIRTIAVQQGFQPSLTLGGKNTESPWRTSETNFCQGYCFNLPAVQTMIRRAQLLTLLDGSHVELQFLHYQTGQYYKT